MVAKQMAAIETTTPVHLAIRVTEERKEFISLTSLIMHSLKLAQKASLGKGES
jgi:hypothetical protein